MRFLPGYTPVALLSFLLAVAFLQLALPVHLAHGHLMVAQRGTLNFVDDGVFMVLSLPVSAFVGIDDNHDGQVSMIEFNDHRADIIDAVGRKVVLSDRGESVLLQGVMLSPVVPHESANGVISQLTVMGRFTVSNPAYSLRFHVGLYGSHATQRRLEITATRDSNAQSAVFELTSNAPSRVIFPDSAWLQQKSVVVVF